MNQESLALLVCLAVILILAALLYAAGRGYLAALTSLGELQIRLDQLLAGTDQIQRLIQSQRPILFDAHKRICAVTKALQKPAH